jgi:hypothetical protein
VFAFPVFRSENKASGVFGASVEFKLNSRCRMLVPAIVLAVSGCQTTQQQDVAVNSSPNAPQVRSDASGNGVVAKTARNSNDLSSQGSNDTAPVRGRPRTRAKKIFELLVKHFTAHTKEDQREIGRSRCDLKLAFEN